MAESVDVTALLVEHRKGQRDALDRLLPIVYSELQKIAARHLRAERKDHTLQPTALVHEAYMKLVDQRDVEWQNRAHFYGIASQIMRRLLVDYARGHKAEKRGVAFAKVSLDEALDAAEERDLDLVALDDAIEELAALDEQQGRIVELRYFGGLNIEETAAVLGISPATVKRDWTMARAWLQRRLRGEGA